MAATDIKKLIKKPDGYWYAVLCNGTEEQLFKDCDCGGDPQPPLETATDCRLANGLRAKFNSAVAVMSGKMDEQPNNVFGDLEAANQWLEYLYVGYLRGFFPVNASDVAFIVSLHHDDEGEISDGVTNIGYELNCAVYAAYIAGDGVLDEAFKTRLEAEIASRTGDAPNVETTRALLLASQLVGFITTNLWQSWLYEGSIVDPGEVGDFDCSECIEEREQPTACGDCTVGVCTRFIHDDVPAGWSVSGYTSVGQHNPSAKYWLVDGVAGGSIVLTKSGDPACITQINVRCYFYAPTPPPRTNRCSLIVDGINISGEITPAAVNVFNENCGHFDTNIKFNISNELGISAIQANTIEIKMPDDRSQMHIVQVDLAICDEE